MPDGRQPDAVIECAGRVAEGQGHAIDEYSQPLGGLTRTPPPKQDCTRQRQQYAGAMTPGADGLTKVKEIHPVASPVGQVLPKPTVTGTPRNVDSSESSS